MIITLVLFAKQYFIGIFILIKNNIKRYSLDIYVYSELWDRKELMFKNRRVVLKNGVD